MDNLAYLFAAYTIIWLVIFGYVLTIFMRQSRLRKELDSWKKTPKERGDSKKE